MPLPPYQGHLCQGIAAESSKIGVQKSEGRIRLGHASPGRVHEPESKVGIGRAGFRKTFKNLARFIDAPAVVAEEVGKS
jgi:hypothetical protein